MKKHKIRIFGISKGGRTAFKISTGTLTGKKPLVRPRRRWEDSIRMNLK